MELKILHLSDTHGVHRRLRNLPEADRSQPKSGNDKLILNQWTKITHWCPAQLFYYFKDAEGGHWCIYLRWDGQRGDEPWQAELVRCDENWDCRWDCPDTVNLLKEKEHTPGTVTGYYYAEECPFLQAKVLELVKEIFPTLEFPNNS